MLVSENTGKNVQKEIENSVLDCCLKQVYEGRFLYMQADRNEEEMTT